jgi:hypothetical protein
MADKPKVPTFRSDKEKKKWDALQHNAGASLHKIAQGNAQPQDIQKVEKTLSNMSKLAKSVFSNAVKAAEAQVNLVQKANLKKSKEDQEAFATAVGEVLKAELPEILAKIKDILEIESLDQDTRFEKTLSSQLNSFASFLPPKDLPTSDDVVSIHEAAIEQMDATDDRKWGTRSAALVRDITNSVADVIKATIMDVAKAARGGGASPSNVPLLGHSGGWEASPSVAKQGSAMVSASKYADMDYEDVIDMEPTSQTSHTTGMATSVRDAVTPLLSGPKSSGAAPSKDSASLASIAESLKILVSRVSGSGNSGSGAPGSTAPGGVPTDDTAGEDKKADVWWRSFGKWVGDKYESAKSKAETAGSWLSALGTGLISLLLAPQLYETIAKKARDLLTWENIKSAVSEAWTYMYDKGKSVIDWVSDKLGLGPAIKVAEDVFDDISSALKWVASKFGFGGKKDSKGGDTGPSLVDTAKATVAAAASAVVRGATALVTAHSSTGFVSRQASKGTGATANTSPTGTIGNDAGLNSKAGSSANAPTTLTNQINNVSSNRSTVGGNNITLKPGIAVGGSTTSVGDSNVRITPAVTPPINGAPAPTGNTGVRAAPAGNSTSTVGIDAFKVHSGVDDSLALMNLGVIMG